MIKAETELRQLKNARAERRLDVNGNPVLMNSRGIPYNYRPTLLLKVLIIIDKVINK